MRQIRRKKIVALKDEIKGEGFTDFKEYYTRFMGFLMGENPKPKNPNNYKIMLEDNLYTADDPEETDLKDFYREILKRNRL